MSSSSEHDIRTEPIVPPATPQHGRGAVMVRHGNISRQMAPLRSSPAMNDKSGKQDDERGTGTGIATRTRTKPKKPSLYRVLLLNDDFTPMEFVVLVLERFFSKNRAQATRIMLHVHNHGVGECGVFTYEVAETKVTQVMDFARKHQHPLQCVLEKK
jgi:ATP-dependent Clp protease adaptor protein ClpS